MHRTASSGCLWKLVTLFILVPLCELWVLLVLARYTSIWTALLVLLVMGVAGTLLVRAQGWRTMRRIADELRSGRLPTDTLLDAAMIFVAGLLLLTPGLLTDLLGVFLLIPFCRPWCRQAVASWLRKNMRVESWTGTAPGPQSQIVDTYVIDRPADERPPDPSRP